ncbi:MAG: AraC family transcriptional regulator [Chloroflexota bacterium]
MTLKRGVAGFEDVDLAPVLFLDEDMAKIINLCDEMLNHYTDVGFGRTTILQSYLRIFLIEAQRLFNQQRHDKQTNARSSLVENFIRLIDKHYLQKQRVSDYATLLGVTHGHLADTTRDKLGMPASRLIQRRILLEAKRLLTYSNKNVGEIAFALGFADPSYFARYFRRETGQTPTAFRTKIRKKYPFPRSES